MMFTVLRLQSLYGDTVQLQAQLDAIINRAPDLNPDTQVEVTETEQLLLLKLCTLFVRKSLVNIACYPLSESAVVFYAEDGTPL